MISISIVSHGQAELLSALLMDLARIGSQSSFEVILTKNIPEQFAFAADDYPFPLRVIENKHPKGFGANHNAAFQQAIGAYFCVMNPDIRIHDNPFPSLLSAMTANVAVVAPSIVAPDGIVEDSVRRFPTPINLFAKLLGISDGSYSVPSHGKPYPADWVGGMFMLFDGEAYKGVNGFDEAFFLYYEDVDICARLWKMRRKVLANPQVCVIHDARRTSRHNLRYIAWHLESMARYLSKHWLRLPSSWA
jgi:N-acetylglucosaminyl-diphospho-decaprenol L-rhamnosyltransferase